MKKSLLIILAAPSGTGKSTICKELIKKNKKWQFSVSATTRTARDGEIDGKDYTFISNSEFEHFVKFGDFIEWEIVHGNKYGTLLSQLEDALDNGKIMLLDLDVKGGVSIMNEFEEDTLMIFIEPPGDNLAEMKEVLEERLSQRANTPITLIKKRLKRLELELEHKEHFEHSFINYDLDETTDEIENIIKENL